MKVVLSQREVVELQRPLVDIGGAAEARGLPAEKLQMAQKAAVYLEEHDLVRTFQDILHGLLVSKPADPHAYVEERLARAKRLAAAKKGEPLPDFAPAAPEPKHAQVESSSGAPRGLGMPEDPVPDSARTNGSRSTNRSSVRMSVRGTEGSRGKVETLMLTLQSANDNLDLVLPFLPQDLRDVLQGDELLQECKQQFKKLDVRNLGSLTAKDMIPVIVQLSTAKKNSVGSDQARRFLQMFDTNEDGFITLDEFSHLVQFVIVAGYLESEEGKAAIEAALVEENNFQDFISMIEQDKERLWSVIPFLPSWLVEHVTGSDFQVQCHIHFDALDKDHSGTLEPHELVLVIQDLSQAHPLTITKEKCETFTRLFDTLGNGVIVRDEFIEFAQFLTVMNFLSFSQEGKQIQQKVELSKSIDTTAKCIAMLEEDAKNLSIVIPHLPGALVRELFKDTFVADCTQAFVSMDKDSNNYLDPAELFPYVVEVSKGHGFEVNMDMCAKFSAFFDKDKNGVICKDEFADMARFITVMSFLEHQQKHQDDFVAEVVLGKERIEQLLGALRENVNKIHEIIPYLPSALSNELLGKEFEEMCLADFAKLDEDASGVLEPRELIPVVLQLSDAHHFSLSEDDCAHFVDIFDVERNGVITRAEYCNLARFMMVMAFMQTEEGRNIEMNVEVAQGQVAVENLLTMLERDRNTLHKVVSFLPETVYEELTSDQFVMACRQRFLELDKDKTNVLRPHELYPVVVDLSKAHPYAVTEDQCIRFTQIFDIKGDGVLHEDEFLDFARFLCVMSYLNTPEGKEAVADAGRIMQDSQRVDDMIQALREDKKNIKTVLPFLPMELRDELVSEHFTLECLKYFTELDKDGNGSLDPEELFPVILSMSDAHHLSLDREQCKQFTAVFDDEKTGVISKEEFVRFSRFMLIIGYLESKEGQAVIRQVAESEADVVRTRPPEVDLTAQPPPEAVEAAPLSPAHLAVDCEFYRTKADKLTAENDNLRQRLVSLEHLVRKMESKLEQQDQRLRHAEVDLRASK